ncbi:helix-turn-helix transcriptional regulator [Chlorobium phaeobacteroides]|uniref:Sigma-70, region 4 type 2 n=1 Tax=Chlorobium phaeobacteroides (strain DSM 266 / SMG 266 / 2430) TaxID=290317 RepID=A1BDV2_CHLPD|nr:DNA-directed RNA polymerase sigma-70 factor [Chlorobium phaeobacteroides]ABL64579.1 Sigma-70, region 4 type 2 [Chlorobium phaeobacteroides DSM 266]
MKQKICPVCGLPVTERSHWHIYHPEEDYTITYEAVGDDILHGQAVTDHDVVLDYMDNELFQSVCDELKMRGTKFSVVINLKHIRGVTLAYKKDFANLVYNWGPIFTRLVIYNVHPDIYSIIEGFTVICPENVEAVIVDDYRDAIARASVSEDNPETDGCFGQEPVYDFRTASKKAFLADLAQLFWIDMLDQPVLLPPAEDDTYIFFGALEEMRKDMLAKKKEHQDEVERLKESYELKQKHYLIQMKSLIDQHKEMITQFEKEKLLLQNILKVNAAEMVVAGEINTTSIDGLTSLIDSAAMSQPLKEPLLNSCKRIAQTGKIENQHSAGASEAEQIFLSLLEQKHPGLSWRDRRIILWIKSDYSNSEIAGLMGISTRGMESIRYRLHKKLALQKHQTIKSYLSSLESDA